MLDVARGNGGGTCDATGVLLHPIYTNPFSKLSRLVRAGVSQAAKDGKGTTFDPAVNLCAYALYAERILVDCRKITSDRFQ